MPDTWPFLTRFCRSIQRVILGADRSAGRVADGGGDSYCPTPYDDAIAVDYVDHVKTLVDLARQGREQDFRDLGAMLGVAKDQLDDLWLGTMARVKA
jgi:hypothetical protein